jgi:hypothetical protein
MANDLGGDLIDMMQQAGNRLLMDILAIFYFGYY